jgi:BirA family transcriptional regulator, biotin operon repressor / biotin---[acetyl-CoA-carboxylase] ligase
MGRVWDSASGNLYASTIVRLRPNDPAAPTLAFLAALSAYDAIRIIAPDCPIMIKWPNDILATSGAKLCGILLERADDAVVVGVGINLTCHPDNMDRPVTSLSALGANPPYPQAVVEILADAFTHWVARWRIEGLTAIWVAWHERAHPLDTALQVNLSLGEQYQGLYRGLSPDGALQLRLADGSIRAIHAADIFLI